MNSPWRRLGCFKQALLVLVHLRKNKTFAQLAAGFGISTATAWRYVDGTLIPTDRLAADEPYYFPKHQHHGMNVQVIARTVHPSGSPRPHRGAPTI